METPQSHLWPGKVCELQNVIKRSVIVSDRRIQLDDRWLSSVTRFDSGLGLSGTLIAYEKLTVEETLRASGGRVSGPSGAAARLGMPCSTLESSSRAGDQQPALSRSR